MGKRLDAPARFPAKLTLPKRKRAPCRAPAPRMNRAAAGLEERRVPEDNTPHLDASPAPDFMEALDALLTYLVETGHAPPTPDEVDAAEDRRRLAALLPADR